MHARALVLLGLLAGSMGCAAKMAEAPYDAGYYGYEDDMVGDMADMEMEESFAAVAMDAEPMAERSRSGRRSRRADKKAAKRSPGAAGGASAPPSPDASGGETAEPEPAQTQDEPEDHGRYIVYTASMQVSVFNLEDAMTRAESLPTKYGGYVQNLSSNYFVMRIPSENLRPAMDELATLGVVDNRTLDAQDVTEEYLDIETRIEVLTATQKQMMELLTKARTVEEALKVRQALDEITMELEVLKGRLRRLASLVSFSTLTLSLTERGPHTPTPSSNDPFPWVDSLGVEATEWK